MDPGPHPLDGTVDVDQLLLGCGHERGDLCPLEGDRRALGVVLVIAGGVRRALHEVVEVAPQGHRVASALVADAPRGASTGPAEDPVSSLEGYGHSTLAIDVADPRSLGDARDRLAARIDRLDVLVNGAGVTQPVAHEDLESLDDQLIDRIFTINWRGPFATIRSLHALLLSAEAPVVVNISSVAGTTGQGSNVAYCASKAALDSLTRSLGRALAPNVRVVSVAPGWVVGEYAEQMPRQVIDAQRTATPMGRLATANDVAAMVSAVVHEMPFTTGAVIPVDGGRPLGN